MHSGQRASAFGAEVKILFRLVSAGRAAPDHAGPPSAADDLQVRSPDLDLLPAGDAGTNLRIQLIDRPAAGHLHVILPSPPEAGNKEEQKLGKGHEHLVSAILSALRADYQLITGEIFSPLCKADHQKHKRPSLSGIQSDNPIAAGMTGVHFSFLKKTGCPAPSITDRIGQCTDAFNLTGDSIAGMQEFRRVEAHPDPLGRSRGNDRSGA